MAALSFALAAGLMCTMAARQSSACINRGRRLCSEPRHPCPLQRHSLGRTQRGKHLQRAGESQRRPGQPSTGVRDTWPCGVPQHRRGAEPDLRPHCCGGHGVVPQGRSGQDVHHPGGQDGLCVWGSFRVPRRCAHHARGAGGEHAHRLQRIQQVGRLLPPQAAATLLQPQERRQQSNVAQLPAGSPPLQPVTPQALPARQGACASQPYPKHAAGTWHQLQKAHMYRLCWACSRNSTRAGMHAHTQASADTEAALKATVCCDCCALQQSHLNMRWLLPFRRNKLCSSCRQSCTTTPPSAPPSALPRPPPPHHAHISLPASLTAPKHQVESQDGQ